MSKRFAEKKEQNYKGCKIITRTWVDNNVWKDEYKSFQALDENNKSLWITDIMFEADYLNDCKKVIDKHIG